MLERKLKGVNFHGTLRALERKYGAEALAAVKRRVPGEAGAALRSGAVVTAGWYPASWYDAVLVAIEEQLPTQRGVIRELAHDAVTDDFSTLFKVISIIVSPHSALTNATRIVGRYIDGGKITVLESREGLVHFRFEEFHGYTTRMWEDFVGAMEAIVDLTRVQRLPTKIVAGGKDGPTLEVLLRYQAR
jgi:hypothetical protein